MSARGAHLNGLWQLGLRAVQIEFQRSIKKPNEKLFHTHTHTHSHSHTPPGHRLVSLYCCRHRSPALALRLPMLCTGEPQVSRFFSGGYEKGSGSLAMGKLP